MSNKDYLSYLPQINFTLCKEYLIGPYFLANIPELFKTKFDTLPILTQLMTITNYKQYINSKFPSQIDYEMLFNSMNIKMLKKLPKIDEIIFFCPSQAFRIPLYSIKLSREINNNPSYTEEHIELPQKDQAQIQRQIELDLGRTSFKYKVLNEPLFRSNFRRLLYEVACRDPSLSYVQGMNFVAAFILMFTGNQLELSTICFLKILNMNSALFNMSFRYCYTEHFALLQNYCVEFKDLLLRYEKEIYLKVIELEIEDYLWIAKWFQTLFVLNFRFEIVMKFWDIVMSKGLDVIVLIALSIASFYKKDILKCTSVEDFLFLFGKMNNLTLSQSKELFSSIASDVINQKYIL